MVLSTRSLLQQPSYNNPATRLQLTNPYPERRLLFVLEEELKDVVEHYHIRGFEQRCVVPDVAMYHLCSIRHFALRQHAVGYVAKVIAHLDARKLGRLAEQVALSYPDNRGLCISFWLPMPWRLTGT